MDNNFLQKKGCILADDMGLGKTCQISTFLMQSYINNHIENTNHDAIHVMIYPPNSLLHYWKDEFEIWREKHIEELNEKSGLSIGKKLKKI